MDRIGEHKDEMWDEQDGFFYDVLRLPDGQAKRLQVRSLVGLLPLCASTVFEEHNLTDHPRLRELLAIARRRHPELLAHIAPTDDGFIGHKNRRLLAVLNKKKLDKRAQVHARRNRVPRTAWDPVALSIPPRAPVFVLGRSSRVHGSVPSSGIQHGHVRGKLKLAWAGVDAGERADHPGAAEPVQLLR